MCNIVLVIVDELIEDGLVLRYWVYEIDDGFFGEEGMFIICLFWLVLVLVEIGEVGCVKWLCEWLLFFVSLLLFYVEEIELWSGCYLGNFL